MLKHGHGARSDKPTRQFVIQVGIRAAVSGTVLGQPRRIPAHVKEGCDLTGWTVKSPTHCCRRGGQDRSPARAQGQRHSLQDGLTLCNSEAYGREH